MRYDIFPSLLQAKVVHDVAWLEMVVVKVKSPRNSHNQTQAKAVLDITTWLTD